MRFLRTYPSSNASGFRKVPEFLAQVQVMWSTQARSLKPRPLHPAHNIKFSLKWWVVSWVYYGKTPISGIFRFSGMIYSRSWSHSNRILFIQSLPWIQGSFPVVLSLFLSLLCWSRRVTSSESRHFLLDFLANKAPLVSVPRWKPSTSRLLRRREWLNILGLIRSADRVMCRDVTRL